jgi:DNA mismatch endonuclease (patch repair protein)
MGELGAGPARRPRPGVPPPSSAAARRRMLATRRRDTAPELALRRALHRLGLRYRIDIAPLPGLRRRADVLFPGVRVAVFVDGCFWHGCPQHGTIARANAAFWRDKIAANQRRDADTDARLRAAGWEVVRVWEHQDAETAARHVSQLVVTRRSPPS